MSFHLLFCVWMVLGLPRVGDWAAGVFRMIAWFSLGTPKGTTLGFFAIANMAIWSTVRYCLRRVQTHACGADCAVAALASVCAVRAAQHRGHAAGGGEVPNRRRLCRDAAPKGGGRHGGLHRGARVMRCDDAAET
jgi:hypothetical protein